MAHLDLAGVTVSHGDRTVLRSVDLAVVEGERVVVLGPSGSGKSTLLRAVAGVQSVRGGRIRIDGRDVTDLPARERDVVLLDQQASLQPHLDVRRNLGFALRLRRVDPEEISTRVDAGARTFSIHGFLRRRPRSLSEGERHEVALARSLVRRGKVLLLDEPTAQVDAGRQGMLLRELLRVQEGYRVTTLAATNDQRVAMTLAHRLVVLEWATWDLALTARPDQAVRLGVRPTDLRPAVDGDDPTVAGVVTRRQFVGHAVLVTVALPTGEVEVALARPAPRVGDRLRLTADAADVHVFGPDGAAVAHGV